MDKFSWAESAVLVTGGTGSFGQKFVQMVLKELGPKRLIVFSRDELKQEHMRQHFPDSGNSPMRYFVGDVRDADRLQRACYGVDIVVHAAALKQVPACEYNPFEAVKTNILGARNVIDAAIDQDVKRVVMVSTDKAVGPINLYGATKLVSEKLFVQGNAYVGNRCTRLACVRYGNVVGSRGSVVPLFTEQRLNGRITLTDPRMTRFWITLEQGVRFVIHCLQIMQGGEIFVPKIPSMRITDLADAVAPDCERNIIGIRPGEKLHEVLISREEARHTIDLGDMFVIQPDNPWTVHTSPAYEGKPIPSEFCYSSDSNSDWLTPGQFRELIAGEDWASGLR